MSLTTDKGTLLLSIIGPIFSTLLTLVEPLFLYIEAYMFIEMIKSFNKWISEKANVREDDIHDLSNWEPPLARTSIIARIAVIFLTILSYIAVFMVLQESRSYVNLASDNTNAPVNFQHAIAGLVTLQLIAASATIYKEEGILSESALIALLASVPIYIASWSYYHLLKENSASTAR